MNVLYSRVRLLSAFPMPLYLELMPALPRGLSALTHNPLLLCYTDSREKAINPLDTPKSASSYLHKDIKETKGEQCRA